MKQGLLILLGAALISAGAYFLSTPRSAREPGSLNAQTKVSLADFDQIRLAERIDDPFQRCLAYPDPPEFNWDGKVVQASCGLLGWKALSLKEIEATLSTGSAETIDRTFETYLQRSYRSGEHGFLTWAFKQAFDKDSDEAEETAERWVELAPESAFALAARGTQRVAAAWGARGTRLSRDTPKKNFRHMEQLAAKAAEDFEKALDRSPRLITAYYGLIRAAQLVGDQDLKAEASTKALNLDAADQWIYDAWLDAVKPKWGGSNALMLAVVTMATRHEDENPLLARVAARLPCVQADPITEDDDQARLALYRVAAKSAPVLCFLNYAGDTADRLAKDDVATVRYFSQSYRFLRDDHSLFRRALALQRLGRSEWALESVDDVIRREPGNVEAILYKGWLLEGMRKFVDAENVFAHVVDIDPLNREANTELVSLYVTVLRQRDKAVQIVDRLKTAKDPRAWLLAAVLDGKDADAECKANLKKYLDLIAGQTLDEYEQRDVDRARQRVAALEKQHNQ